MERRSEERVSASLPVEFGTATGLTRDVSASGICFEIDAPFALGSPVSFTMELEAPKGKMMLKCRGEIVRVESRGKRVGIAVRIAESTLGAAQMELGTQVRQAGGAPAAGFSGLI